jgi:hypothetical protein
VVNAQVVVSVPSTSGRASVACLIGGEGDYRGLLNVPTGSWQMVTIPVEHAFSLSSAQTIKVTCSASAKFQGGATVIATAVSAIHNQ